jgi:hypothetical protein
MVYEEVCDSCGRSRITKLCTVKKINVCYTCCVECYFRSKCNARVWFRELVPVRV